MAAFLPKTWWQIDWEIFAMPTVSSLVFGLFIGIISTIIGALLAVAALISSRKRLLTAIFAAPLFFPSIATGIAIIHSPLPIPAYSWQLLTLIYLVHGIPISFIFHFICISINFNVLSTTAAALGITPVNALRKILQPRIKKTLLPASILVSTWVIFDSSANLVFSGTCQPLAKVFYNSVNIGPVSIFDAIKLSLLIALFSGLILFRVITALKMETLLESTHHLPDRYYAKISRPLAALGIIYGLFLCLILVSAMQLFGQNLALQFPSAELLHTLTTLILVVPLSTMIGFRFSLIRWKHPSIVRAILVFFSLFSFTSCGMCASAFLRDTIRVGNLPLIPTLIGTGTLGNGILGMILCYLIVCVPIASLILQLFTRQTAPQVAAAKVLGAPKLRIFVMSVHNNRHILLAVMGFLSMYIISQTSPAIYLQPTDFQLLAPTLVNLAEAGFDQQAMLNSLISAALSICFLGISYVTLTHQRKDSKR